MQEQIFDPSLAAGTDTRRLGLAMAAGIVQRHGGTLALNAVTTGGNCYVLSLPINPLG